MIINENFKKLIPPLSNAEFTQLELNIKENGCLDAIVLWDDIIIDGHNRYEICTKNDISFETENLNFENENEAKTWMINNQLGRRNLTDGWRWELIQTKKDLLIKKGREKQKETLKQNVNSVDTVKSIVDKTDNHNTRDELSKDLGWSTGKTAMADKVWSKADSKVKEEIKSGEKSINQAYKEITKKDKQEKLEIKKQNNLLIQKKEVEKNRPVIYLQDCKNFLNAIENNSIDLLITDPPYSTDVDDIVSFAESWVNLALSKVKKDGRAFICIGAYPKELNAYLNILLKQDKFIIDNPLIWTYRNTLGITPKMKYNLNYQIILHLYSEKSKELDTSITNEMFSVQDINAPDGRLANRYHTWQKPDELANRLIRHTTNENDKIIDCFACTGTFLIAASKLNRFSTGCDNNIENIRIAEQRGCKYENL